MELRAMTKELPMSKAAARKIRDFTGLEPEQGPLALRRNRVECRLRVCSAAQRYRPSVLSLFASPRPTRAPYIIEAYRPHGRDSATYRRSRILIDPHRDAHPGLDGGQIPI